MTHQIVVSGGAGYWCGPDGLRLDEYGLSLTGKRRPRVCAVCTASGDSETYISGFYEQFGERCEASHLSLFLPPFDGTILHGSSAGGICWFESGLSDSLSFDGSLLPLCNGLGFIGIDEFAAVHFVDGVVERVVATCPDSTAHRVARSSEGPPIISALPATPV